MTAHTACAEEMRLTRVKIEGNGLMATILA